MTEGRVDLERERMNSNNHESTVPVDPMTIVRHFTATAFVVHDDHVALHWHPKVRAWLPPGGHIEENEDPVSAVLREVREETGLDAEIVPTSTIVDLDYPEQVFPPFTIMVWDIDDPVEGFHQHIDMIYFCRLVGRVRPLEHGWQWVSRPDVDRAVPLLLPDGRGESPPEDVRVLALHAFRIVTDAKC